MHPTPSWLSRCALALLVVQLASACNPDPQPPPPPASDTTPPSTRADPAGGNFGASVTVTLRCEDGTGSGCAATYYTTDGSAPTASSSRYSAPVVLAKGGTLKFFSVDTAGNAEAVQTQAYVVDSVPPTTVASPTGGNINSARSVTLQCTDGDGTGSGCAATYYTTDGTPPSTSSPRYTSPIAVSASVTLRFFSVDAVGNTEAAKTERYTLDATAPTVTANPAGGNYLTAQTVTLSCDDGPGTGCGPIHYTTDGSVPTDSSPAYTAPLSVSANTPVRFFAMDGAGNTSPVVSAVYVIDETGPATTANPPGGFYNTTFSVTLACDDGAGSGCAATYYTTNGSPPTTSSPRYTTALPITSNTTLKFFSVDKLGNPGPTGTAQYTLDFTAPVTTANPPGDTYSGAQTVALECTDGTGTGCAATYYTLDGTTPTRSSARYTTPLRITTNTTLRFFSVDKANNAESVRSEVYDLDSVAPVTRANPRGGVYKSNQSVVLSCDDGVGSGCAETHYTFDGSTPTMASPKYTGPILLTVNTSLKFFSVDAAGNMEAVQTETYTIDTAAPSTTANPPAGTYGGTQSVTLACDDGTSGSGCSETRYTVDGTAPTTSSPLYTGAISISDTTTLRYFSTDKAGNRESTRVALYTLDRTAPTVSASVKSGLYNKAQSVTFTCSDTGGSTCGAIHYTTDGTVPTTASAIYSAPLTISVNTTLKFLAVDKVGNASDVQTETYRIDDVAPTTTATPPGGPFADTQSVTLVCGDGSGSGCTATYYTLDGTTPTRSSSAYSAPLTVSASTTLKFFSVDVAGNDEPVKTASYVIDREKPTVAADPVGGTYRITQSVTLSCTDTGGSGCASIHYTTDGSPPTTGSASYSAPLTVSANTTLRFLAVDKAGNVSASQTVAYVIDTVAPSTTANPTGGSFRTAKNITLNCSDGTGSGCADTYYTTDGSLPSTSSKRYTGPFQLSANTTLKFFSVDVAGNSEPVRTETYTFDLDTVAPTTSAAPPAGTYGSTVSVTLSCDDGTTGIGCAETRYTVDGTTPTTTSPLYTSPISIPATTTLRYFSTDAAGNREPVRLALYTVDTVAPTVSANPKGGLSNTTLSVTLSCSDSGGSTCDAIHYTTDGSTPTTGSTPYTSPLSISTTTTLKFLAADKVGNVSGVQTERYVIDRAPPATMAAPGGNLYASTQTVTLVCDDGSGSGCSATYYTLDGTPPTRTSATYSAPLSISATGTLKFFSVDAAGNEEPMQLASYVIDREKPSVAAAPPGGKYRDAQTVTLSCTDTGGGGCASIHYTTDGSAPTTGSPLYSAPLAISASTVLRSLAVDKAGNMSAIQSDTYVIDAVAPGTMARPPGGTYSSVQTVTLECADTGGSDCAATYYTTDGSTPTTGSKRYTGPFPLSANTTLKFFSVDGAGNSESPKTETYVINPDSVAPTTRANPPGGTFSPGLVISLECSDNTGCASTYYTADGSVPTTASPRYTGPLTIFASTTLRFFSVDVAGNAEPPKIESYVINYDTSPPSNDLYPRGGTYTEAQYVSLYCFDDYGCEGTYYTLDGSVPTTASPRYTGPILIFASTTLRFFSVDLAGNFSPVWTESYTITETPPTDASARIAYIRSLPDSSTLSEALDGALVTYTKASTGTLDPAGFFLQGAPGGPALFVAVDPASLSTVPLAGDRVSLVVNEKKTVSGLVQVTKLAPGSFYVLSRGESVEPMRIDASSSDLVIKVGDYESTLISFSGTVASAFGSAGNGHVSASMVSVGNPTVTPDLKLRLTTSLQDTLDVTQDCSVTVKAPLWRFTTQAQPSAWKSDDLTILSCPAPKVVSALSTGSTGLVVTFDRRIDPASLISNGSQFTFDNGLVAASATVNGRQVQLVTSSQMAGTIYRVTVASSLKDTRATGIDAAANSTTFPGNAGTPSTGTALLLINEVNANIASGRDLIELLAVTGGSVDKMTVVSDTTVVATLPNVTVAAGDIIVVHLLPDKTSGTADGPGSETLSKSQYPKSQYTSNYDTAWDFHGGTTGINYSNSHVIRVKDALGSTLDAVPFVTSTSVGTAFLTQLQTAQTEGQWLPSSCGGAACTPTTAPDISVIWDGMDVIFGDNRTISIQRRSGGVDTQKNSDWNAVGASSFGLPNP